MSTHVAHIARDHCLAPERVDAPIYGGRYRRLFDELPALDVDERALHALGRAGGPCDVGVDFADEPDATWFYVLKEAEVRRGGDGLGPVGGRIVGEVLVGIIDADPESFRATKRDWTPTLPAHEPGRFGVADVLVPHR